MSRGKKKKTETVKEDGDDGELAVFPVSMEEPADKELPTHTLAGATPLDDRTPLNVVQLDDHVIVSFEWFHDGNWHGKNIDGRIVPPHELRDPEVTKQFDGVSLYHCVDHIQLEYNGCVRCVPLGKVKWWGYDPPQEMGNQFPKAATNG